MNRSAPFRGSHYYTPTAHPQAPHDHLVGPQPTRKASFCCGLFSSRSGVSEAERPARVVSIDRQPVQESSVQPSGHKGSQHGGYHQILGQYYPSDSAYYNTTPNTAASRPANQYTQPPLLQRPPRASTPPRHGGADFDPCAIFQR